MRIWLAGCILIPLWWGSLSFANEVRFLPSDDTVGVMVEGKLLTVLHTKGQKCPYFHPLLTTDGRLLTRQFPLAESFTPESKDHPHHIGLHYAHGAVRTWKVSEDVEKIGKPADFWHNGKATIRNDKTSVEEEKGRLILENSWLSEKGEVIATDRTQIGFGGDNLARWIDWKVTITAPAEHGLIFGDTKEGTFSIRLADELAMRPGDKKLSPDITKGHLANSEGIRGKDVWGKRAAWCAAHGDLEGAPVVVALMDHPKNPRHPTWWMARDYGMFNINPFGISYFENKARGSGDFKMQAGESVTFRYRLILMEKSFDSLLVDDYYAKFTN
jgi:hypothetical protein